MNQTAHSAVSLNPKGIGQVLVYPYYSVNNGINTLLSVVNTSNQTKALKIKFLESKNNRDVLAFNIYLGPYDTWTSALVNADSTIPNHTGEESVKLFTNDSSCTVPAISGQEFLPFAMEGEFEDAFSSNLSRATEGQIHIIDMGNVIGEYGTWADPRNSATFNCSSLNSNWVPPNGAWQLDANENISPPSSSGDIYGWVSLIDVQTGVDVGYNAQAIQAYTNQSQHLEPASLAPNLASGNQTQSVVSSQSVSDIAQWASPVDAVSSIFMSSELFTDYVITDSIGANTEWLLSFPTKKFYTDPLYSNSAEVVAPFSNIMGGCESADINLYSRNAETTLDSINLCFGTNVVEFSDTSEPSSTILASKDSSILESNFDSGWAQIVFSQSIEMQDDLINGNSTLIGLPVTGFSIQRYVNSNLEGGVLANYAGLFQTISKTKTR
jgi:hypothetical protein